ncbi:hypothetical protein T11_7007 [Trichinella zimbabwensis]|uniref:Uncharacterized protein n=1 Tax=Trichinella zimbabwensis TaxID=268475 RepID=A0A0V1G769_9BILA|nr:hypothetical protein T11_7007 [Trichinella zimbabwensis]
MLLWILQDVCIELSWRMTEKYAQAVKKPKLLAILQKH